MPLKMHLGIRMVLNWLAFMLVTVMQVGMRTEILMAYKHVCFEQELLNSYRAPVDLEMAKR